MLIRGNANDSTNNAKDVLNKVIALIDDENFDNSKYDNTQKSPRSKYDNAVEMDNRSIELVGDSSFDYSRDCTNTRNPPHAMTLMLVSSSGEVFVRNGTKHTFISGLVCLVRQNKN
jgi:hypothetical protein